MPEVLYMGSKPGADFGFLVRAQNAVQPPGAWPFANGIHNPSSSSRDELFVQRSSNTGESQRTLSMSP
jgi:hypothetical protein